MDVITSRRETGRVWMLFKDSFDDSSDVAWLSGPVQLLEALIDGVTDHFGKLKTLLAEKANFSHPFFIQAYIQQARDHAVKITCIYSRV